MMLDPAAKRRASLVYFLHMIGTFMFLFLFLAAFLQWRWRWVGEQSDVLRTHLQWQTMSLILFSVGAALALVVPHPIAQLCLAYGAMFLLLGRAIYGNWKLRKTLPLPQSLFSRAGE